MEPASRQSRLSIWLEADAALVLRCGLGGDIVAACMRLARGMNHAALVYVCVRVCKPAPLRFARLMYTKHMVRGEPAPVAERRRIIPEMSRLRTHWPNFIPAARVHVVKGYSRPCLEFSPAAAHRWVVLVEQVDPLNTCCMDLQLRWALVSTCSRGINGLL